MNGAVQIELFGETLFADPDGALFAPGHDALIVADLHLEKGSALARRGVLLPPFDSAATLARLAAAIGRRKPRRVIALGDNFHDDDGPARLSASDRAALAGLMAGREWLWIAGNHDPAPPAGIGGDFAREAPLGALTLRHEPTPAPIAGAMDEIRSEIRGEIAGHLHPVARLGGRRRAFVCDGRRLLAPAFGAYAGGLNLRDPAIASLFSGRPLAYVLGASRVYRVCASRCQPGR